MRTVEAELPGGVPAAAMPLPPVPVAKPAVPDAKTPIGPIKSPPRVVASPADDGEGFAPFDIDFSAPIEYPAAGDADARGAAADALTPPTASLVPDLELVDFAELGAPLGDDMAPTVTVLEESVDETIDVGLPADLRDASKPVLRVVADNTAAHVGAAEPRTRSAHGPELMLLTDAPARVPEVTTPIEPEEVTVGSVTLSAALWRILCDEADQNVAVLQHEVSILQFDPDHMPVVAMVRASHTLCGIHRTGGIALIATTARALEQALLALEECGAPFPSTAQPILARATAGLAHFVSRVKHRDGFSPSDEREAADICVELEEMRRDALADMPVVDPLIPPESAREFDMPLATADAGFSATLDEPVDVAAPMAEHDGHVTGTMSASSVAAASPPPDAGAMLLTQWTTKDALPADAPAASDAAEPATQCRHGRRACGSGGADAVSGAVRRVRAARRPSRPGDGTGTRADRTGGRAARSRSGSARAGMAASAGGRPAACSASGRLRRVAARRRGRHRRDDPVDLPRRGQRAPSAGERAGQDLAPRAR